MEAKIQYNIIYLFGALLIISFLGFYNTYLIHFPTFEGFKMSHHFHGAMALSWILLLISQAYLIRVKNYKLHRSTGKLSYVIMPLFLISLFFVSKTGYYRVLATQGEVEAIAGTSLSIPDMIYMTLFYTLAMVYRKNVHHHMRYMIFTGMSMIGPGLVRYLITGLGVPFEIGLASLGIFMLSISVLWLIADIRNKKSPIPLIVFIVVNLLVVFCQATNHDAWYQAAAGWVIKAFY